MLIAIDLALALLLFYVINWLGDRSGEMGYGYLELSVFARADEAPAFNFTLRALGPVVFMIMVSALAYVAGLGELAKSSVLVVIFYFSLRTTYLLAMGRSKLVNWHRYLITMMTSLLLAYGVSYFYIQRQTSLLPTVEGFTDQIWWMVAVYLYLIFNIRSPPSQSTESRKEKYLNERYKRFKARFDSDVMVITRNERLKILIYSIMIMEDFNRPALFRLVENVAGRIGIAKTFGIMQVCNKRVCSDRESVRLGSAKVLEDLEHVLTNHENATFGKPEYWTPEALRAALEHSVIHETLVRYNPSGDYAREVVAIYDHILATTPSVEDLVDAAGVAAEFKGRYPHAWPTKSL